MIFKVLRNSIEVVPECPADVAYVEDTLGLALDGEAILLKRKNAIGMYAISHLETDKSDPRLENYKHLECLCRELVDSVEEEEEKKDLVYEIREILKKL